MIFGVSFLFMFFCLKTREYFAYFFLKKTYNYFCEKFHVLLPPQLFALSSSFSRTLQICWNLAKIHIRHSSPASSPPSSASDHESCYCCCCFKDINIYQHHNWKKECGNYAQKVHFPTENK